MNTGKDMITTFVRNVLGCKCPDEVFKNIEVSEIELWVENMHATRIVVGETLLVYILPDTAVDVIADNIARLLASAKQDRDAHGYNRFRLVLRGGGRKDLEQQLAKAFAEEAAGDEKLHLHFVAAADLAWLER